MDRYHYRLTAKTLFLDVTPAEAKLLAHFAGQRLLSVHRTGEERSIAKAAVVSAAEELLRQLEAEEALLPYRYSVAYPHPLTGEIVRGGGGFGCEFEGVTAIVRAGSGYCFISDLAGNVLRDLRHGDAAEVRNGRGRQFAIKATRRREPFCLTAKLQLFVEELRSVAGTEVVVTVEEGIRDK